MGQVIVLKGPGTIGYEEYPDEDYAASRLLPVGLDPTLGIFSHMTAIALNGILDAGIRLGETVAMFGLGVPAR